jgi:hypothetical protein
MRSFASLAVDHPMEIPNNTYPALDFDESSSSDASPLSSAVPSPSLSLVSTPITSVSDLPREIKRDPHNPPVFDKQPTEPIFYLPPLLSSLPHTYSPQTPTVTKGRVPRASINRLPDIDPPSLSLHKALHNFTPVTEDYAITPYVDAFNWDEIELPEEDEREWYSITFRSIRRQGSDSGRQ